MIHLPPAHIHLHCRTFLLILLATVCAIGCSEDSKNSDSPTQQDLNVCTSNADCAARLDGFTQCDIINRICVAPQAPVQECTNDIDCAARLDGKTLCDTALHQCVAPVPATQECTNDTWNCYGNILTQCVSGKWQISQTCQANTRCNAEKGLCEPNQSECKDTEHFFANQCEADDVTHCGTHTNDCTKLSGWKNGNCIGKACFAEECEIGYHLASLFDSDNKERTICEEDTHDACGSINTKCGKEEICAQGKCTDKCRLGEVSCNGSCIDPMTSRNFCGADVSCSSYIPCSEFEKCIDGKCVPSSCQNAEESLCTSDDQTICVNIHGNHPNHCGGCGAVCSDSETAKAAGCSHGQCIYTCKNGAVNCGSDTDPMCLSKDQLKSDPLHCGNCDTSCKANELCQNGQCIISACTGNECFYHNACINQNDHCGTQCLNCNTANDASAGVCQNGSCVITSCIAGYHLTNKGLCEPDTDTCCGTTCQNCGLDSSCIDGSCQKECLTFTEPEIGNYAFANWDTNHNGCISRSEAEAVTEIPEKAFYNNTSLKSLSDLAQFPNLRTIGDSAFEGCKGLTSVTLPQATHIGDSAFKMGWSEGYCYDEFSDECYYDYDEDKWFVYGSSVLTSIDLPQATHIGSSAFEGCKVLTSIDLPQATYIGDSAFAKCTALASIDLPQATEIGNYAFMGTIPTSVSLPKATKIGDYAFFGGLESDYCGNECDHSEYLQYISNIRLKSVSLPQATHIGDYAFVACEALESIDLPQATEIGDYAFMGTIPTSVSLPKATKIGRAAFAGLAHGTCTWGGDMCAGHEFVETIAPNKSLTSIDLPQATHIGDYAFAGRTGLTSVSLPQATSIGFAAFVGGVDAVNGDPTVESSIIVENKSLKSIDLPKATSVNGFSGCTGLTSISLPQATSIGWGAFSGCTGLKSIDLPQATEIRDSAFRECTNLTSVSLPKATKFGDYTFFGCTALKSVDLPQATEIGDVTFYGCTSLTSISLPKATYIGVYAFSGCTGLTSIVLPQATEIGYSAFRGCTDLTSISLPEATEIGNYAFSGCTELSSLALTSPGEITLNYSLEPYPYSSETLTLDKVLLTLHQNKAVGGSSSPLCTSATEWGGKTWKEIKFVK